MNQIQIEILKCLIVTLLCFIVGYYYGKRVMKKKEREETKSSFTRIFSEAISMYRGHWNFKPKSIQWPDDRPPTFPEKDVDYHVKLNSGVDVIFCWSGQEWFKVFYEKDPNDTRGGMMN